MTFKDRNSATIKSLQENAKRGNFFSAYQLYEYYLNGQYVDKDDKKAQSYLEQALSTFDNRKLRITKLSINNFRAIKNIDIQIVDPHLTVIIGNNGTGKTTILDALAKSLSWLSNRISKNGGSGLSIELSDISNYDNVQFSSIVTNFNFNKKLNADMELVKVVDGCDVNKKSTITKVSTIGSIYKHANSLVNDFNIPLLAFYNVERTIGLTAKDMKSAYDADATFDKFDGNRKSIYGSADFKDFFRWFKRLDDIQKERSVNRSSHTRLSEIFKRLKNDSDSITKKELEEEILKLNREQSAIESDIDIQKLKKTLDKVVGAFMNGYSNLAIEIEPSIAMTIEKNGQKLNILQLSQGEKSLIALILDIGRRLIMLNPGLEDPLAGDGIVLIDEIDLHLHPAWQRKVIKLLPQVFKNIQFIVTTHSPQVVGEVKHSQLVLLRQNEDNSVNYENANQSFGLTSDSVLNELMSSSDQVYGLNRNEDVDIKLNKINSLISSRSFEEATYEIKKLENELNGEIPELIKAKFDIELFNLDE